MATKKLVLPELFSPGFAGGGMLMSNRNVLDKSTGVPDVISVEAQNMIRDKVLASQPKPAPVATAAPVVPSAPAGDGKIYTTDKSVFNEQPAQGGQFNFPLGELLARVGGLTGDVMKGDTDNKTQGIITDTIASGQKMRTAKDMSMPDSDVSKRYQKIASGIFGGKDFSGWAAADFDKFMPEFKDLFDKQNAPVKGVGGGSGGGTEAKKGFQVPGYETASPEYAPTKEDAEDVKKQMIARDKVKIAAEEMKNLANTKGTMFMPFSTDAKQYDSAKSRLQIAVKEAAGLGALSGQDFQLMEGIYGGKIGTKEGVGSAIDQYLTGDAKERDAIASQRGFKRSGGSNIEQLLASRGTSAPQVAKAPSAGQQAVKLGEALAKEVSKASPSAPAKAAPAMVTMEKDGKRRQVPSDMVSVYEKQGAKVVR